MTEGRSSTMTSTIPAVILGTMTFGDTVDEATAAEIVAAALDAGVTWFDTANSYSDGLCEQIVGRILGARSDITLATKVGQPQSELGTEHLLSAPNVRRSVEASLTRLGRERVDLLYLHKPDRSTPLAETLSEVAALIRAGKVGQFGVFELLGLADRRDRGDRAGGRHAPAGDQPAAL